MRNLSEGEKMINGASLSLIEGFEGLRLTAYKDSVGVPTIGYGHTRGVKMGQTITALQAADFLRQDLASAEEDVDRVVKQPMTDNQRGALVSFTFNLGAGNLLKLLKNGLAEVPARIDLFDHAGGKELPGLLRRREAEKKLFLQP